MLIQTIDKNKIIPCDIKVETHNFFDEKYGRMATRFTHKIIPLKGDNVDVNTRQRNR